MKEEDGSYEKGYTGWEERKYFGKDVYVRG